MITAYLKARPIGGKMQVMDTVHTGSALAKRQDVAAVRVVEIPDSYENKPYIKKTVVIK